LETYVCRLNASASFEGLSISYHNPPQNRNTGI